MRPDIASPLTSPPSQTQARTPASLIWNGRWLSKWEIREARDSTPIKDQEDMANKTKALIRTRGLGDMANRALTLTRATTPTKAQEDMAQEDMAQEDMAQEDMAQLRDLIPIKDKAGIASKLSIQTRGQEGMSLSRAVSAVRVGKEAMGDTEGKVGKVDMAGQGDLALLTTITLIRGSSRLEVIFLTTLTDSESR